MERKYYINVLRLIATLSVVLLHTSAGVLDNSFSPSEYEFVYSYFKFLNQFAVPVFVMISGYLFLNPSKSINYGLLFSKYVRRIVLALFIFGLPMCIIETSFWGDNIFNAFDNFLRGRSWAHMWYLYMLIGLYLLTPIIRPFIVNSSIKDIKIGLCVLFVLSSLLPTLNIYGISVSSYLILPPYIFLYLLGYYLGDLEKNNLSIKFLFGLLFIYFILTCYRVLYAVPGNSYSDVIVIFGASVVFLLFKKGNLNWDIANSLSKYCFAVYLIHPIFINFFYKYFHIYPHSFINPWIGILVFFVFFTILSFLTSMILMKIPFLRKNVL